MKNYLIQSLVVLFVLNISATTALAFEEEHEAHEHGHATLMLVQEKDELQIVFKSPAANIVGFEHQPGSTEQKAKVKAAEALLKDASKLFQMTEAAKCSLEHVDVKSALLDADEDEHQGHHEKHSDHHDDGHDMHHEDAHHNHHEAHAGHDETHSEFEVEYHFECANIDALKEIKHSLFTSFPTLEEVDAQLILKSGQRLQELDHSNTSIKL